MSLSSYLTCNLVPRRGTTAGDDRYDVGQQPQTATCCTALHRAVPADGLAAAHPRYAPLRTPGSSSAAALVHPQPSPSSSSSAAARQQQQQEEEEEDAAAAAATRKMMKKKKAVRKCKSTVEDVDVSRLIEGPRLRRSGGVRRDWSFEDLRGGATNNAAA